MCDCSSVEMTLASYTEEQQEIKAPITDFEIPVDYTKSVIGAFGCLLLCSLFLSETCQSHDRIINACSIKSKLQIDEQILGQTIILLA